MRLALGVGQSNTPALGDLASLRCMLGQGCLWPSMRLPGCSGCGALVSRVRRSQPSGEGLLKSMLRRICHNKQVMGRLFHVVRQALALYSLFTARVQLWMSHGCYSNAR